MSKVKITNVSKSKSPLYCGLKDGSSLSLQYGQSKIVEDSLLTPYLNRRIKYGDYKVAKLAEEVKTEVKQEDTDNKVKNSGKKKTTVESKGGN